MAIITPIVVRPPAFDTAEDTLPANRAISVLPGGAVLAACDDAYQKLNPYIFLFQYCFMLVQTLFDFLYFIALGFFVGGGVNYAFAKKKL